MDNLRITHDGFDDITLEWVRLMLDDSSYLICLDGQVLHGELGKIADLETASPRRDFQTCQRNKFSLKHVMENMSLGYHANVTNFFVINLLRLQV